MSVEFKTPWFQIRYEGRYILDEKNGLRGAAVLVSDVEDRFAFVDVYRPAIGRLSLEAPRGFAEDGEEAIEAAAREFQEETGQVVTVEHLTRLGEVAPNSGLASTRVQLFEGRTDVRFASASTDGEVERVCFIPRAEVAEAVHSGRIVCGITLALICLQQAHRPR